jgi:SpoVK/Ycf46/Vps4 family AAA+-type ATPase
LPIANCRFERAGRHLPIGNWKSAIGNQKNLTMPADRDELDRLITARHACIAISTPEEEYVLTMVRELAVERGQELWVWSVTQGLREGLLAGSPPSPDSEHPAAALYLITQGRPQGQQGIYVMLDLAGHLKDERTLRAFREAAMKMDQSGSRMFLIDHEDLPPAAAAVATRFEVSLPDEDELEQLVKSTLRRLNDEGRIEVAVGRHDLDTFLKNLRGLTRRQARQLVYDAVCDDRRFDVRDVNRMLANKRRAIGDGPLEYVESPVSLDEIGGLARLKQWLKHRECCETDAARLFGLTAPKGILMLGVQGAGKSLAAKAVATAWRRPLLRLDSGALYDRYIGESERRLREALRQAERMAPVVLWIDEIEKGFASAASLSSDGGLSKRMFGTLLTWMQERNAGGQAGPVFLIATANDIEALPPELLRKGRFDEIFFVDLPGLEARYEILRIHLSKRKRDPKQFDLDALVEASEGHSGAEIEQAVISAMHDAFAAGEELKTEHVRKAISDSPPLSVTMAERIAGLRAWAKGRCVPAE